MRKVLLLFLFIFVFFFLQPSSPVFAWGDMVQNRFAPCTQTSDASGTYYTCSTGFGTFDTRPTGFITSLFRVILSISGAVAILLIIVSGYKMIMSRGNPEKVTEARERLTSAIVGLLFIIFSLVILQIIGVDILRIPQFK
jgi:hypothetical protein